MTELFTFSEAEAYFTKKLERVQNFAYLNISPSFKAVSDKYYKDSLFQIKDPGIYVGIPGQNCDQELHYWFRSRCKHDANLTFSNLFSCKRNILHSVIRNLSSRKIILVTPLSEKESFENNYGKLAQAIFIIPEITDTNSLESISRQFCNQYKGLKNAIILVSCGENSPKLIQKLFFSCGGNTFIDVSIETDTNFKLLNDNWMYAPGKTSFDVSVVVNLYRRPECLEKQLEAIEKQSLKPKEIMIFQDPVASGQPISFPEHLRDRFTVVEISKENVGVWGRFQFAKKAKSKYICVFDDDTIPGRRWLENCHNNMLEQPGLYGANGVIMIEPEVYPKQMISMGWKNPNPKRLQVDFVGHSWFFQKDWLDDLFASPQSIQNLKVCGEDMSFSYQLQSRRNIQTFVPPHPSKEFAFFGSHPKLARLFGHSEVALSKDSQNMYKYNHAMNLILALPVKWHTVLSGSKKFRTKIARYVKLIQTITGMIPFRDMRRTLRGCILSFLIENSQDK